MKEALKYKLRYIPPLFWVLLRSSYQSRRRWMGHSRLRALLGAAKATAGVFRGYARAKRELGALRGGRLPR